MPRKLRPDDTVLGWRILHEIHVGPLAMSYAALSPGGGKAFLKLYKSPTRTVPWYRGFMNHQIDLNVRIETGPARAFTVRRLDGFEAEFGSAAVAYFQAFEFVEGGEDLETIVSRIRQGTGEVNWPQRILMSKVLLAGVKALHDSGVVHGDLKPANVQVFRDPSIIAQYRLKLIDLDFAVIPDMQAPWHGLQGYVGTPGYYSPEHLIGRAPIPASDVFTCGIMLHELLTDYGNPYRMMADEDYRRATNEWKAPKPILAGPISGASSTDVVHIIHQCLQPDPAKRPDAGEVLAVLNGRGAKVAARPAARSKAGAVAGQPDGPAPARAKKSVAGVSGAEPPVAKPARSKAAKVRPEPVAPPKPSPPVVVEAAKAPQPIVAPRPAVVTPLPPVIGPAPVSTGTTLILANATDPKRRLTFRLGTPVGRRLLESISDGVNLAHETQYWLVRENDGGWWLRPESPTTNQTLLNGREVTEKQRLRAGDRVAVGNEQRGTERHVVIVGLESESREPAP
jgi:hypothetical protein